MVNFNRIKKIYSARYQSSRSTVALTDNWKSIFRLTKEISSILLSTYHKKQILLSHLMKRCKGIIHEILFLYYTILLDSFYLILSTSYVANFQVSCCFQQTQCWHMLTHFLCFYFRLHAFLATNKRVVVNRTGSWLAFRTLLVDRFF